MNQIRFALRVIVHPFDGFWDMKHEKRGRLGTALLLIAGWIASNIFFRQVVAFLFNLKYFIPLDLAEECRNVLLIVILVAVANWSVTTLMDGKGTLKEIIMVIGYSCVPLVLTRLGTALISNIATFAENGFISFFNILSIVWFVALLFFGTMTIHEYSFWKNIFTALLTIVSMVVILFVCIVMVSLMWQLLGFFMAAWQELRLRY